MRRGRGIAPWQPQLGSSSSSGGGNSTNALAPTRPNNADAALPELDMPDGITYWTAELLDRQRNQAEAKQDATANTLIRRLCFTIDLLGLRSQRAQGINAPLTSVARLHESKSYRLYLLVHERRGVAVLKMGVKKLFVEHPVSHALVEVDPLCVLDFFVDESCQRKGFGHRLYEYMLQAEQIRRPEVLAIDRPSPKLLAFLAKYYNLQSYAPQVNNFVVYDRFFQYTTVSERGQLRRLPSPSNEATTATKENNNSTSNSTSNSKNVAGNASVSSSSPASYEGKPHVGAMLDNKTASPLLPSSGAGPVASHALRSPQPMIHTSRACPPRLAPLQAHNTTPGSNSIHNNSNSNNNKPGVAASNARASAFVSGLRSSGGGGAAVPRAEHEQQYRREALRQQRRGEAGQRTTLLL